MFYFCSTQFLNTDHRWLVATLNLQLSWMLANLGEESMVAELASRFVDHYEELLRGTQCALELARRPPL